MAPHTAKEIKTITEFENKWKISTNKNTFQVIPIGRIKTVPIKIDQDILKFEKEGKALGTTITRDGFVRHIGNRIRQASAKLKDLYRFRDLCIKNKRKLYLALIRPVLEYPPIPLHTASKTNILKMQRVQNKEARIITPTRLRDTISSRIINETANLPAINVHSKFGVKSKPFKAID